MEKQNSDIEKLVKTLSKDEEFKTNAQDFIALQQVYAAAIKEVTTKLEILDMEFQVKHDHNPIHNIESRLKSPRSLYEKLKKKNLPLDANSIRNSIYDIAGVRVICNYVDDIDRIATMLLKQSDVTLVKIKDYVKHPKSNGYRSLHLVVKVPIFLAESIEWTPVEIQIRTIAMDFWASLEHKLKYKSGEKVSEDLARRLKECAENIAKLDNEMQEIHKEIQDSSR